MISLEEAIAIAEAERGLYHVDSVLDCGDKWAFTFAEDKGKIGSAPVVVSKINGECEFVFAIDYIYLAKTGKYIPLPDERGKK